MKINSTIILLSINTSNVKYSSLNYSKVYGIKLVVDIFPH